MLSDEEQSQLAQIKAAERERLKPRAMTERRRWAERYAVRHNLSVEEAERIATAATDSHTLHEEFELEFDELGKVTVGEMLAMPTAMSDRPWPTRWRASPMGAARPRCFAYPTDNC